MKKVILILIIVSISFVSCKKTDIDTDDETNIVTETTVVELAKTTTSWNDAALPNYPTGTPEITILRIVIPPKTKLKTHKHPVINAGVLLKGELTVISENDTLHMQAGDPIVELVNTWHYGENEGDEPAEIIVFYAGAVDIPITVVQDN